MFQMHSECIVQCLKQRVWSVKNSKINTWLALSMWFPTHPNWQQNWLQEKRFYLFLCIFNDMEMERDLCARPVPLWALYNPIHIPYWHVLQKMYSNVFGALQRSLLTVHWPHNPMNCSKEEKNTETSAVLSISIACK